MRSSRPSITKPRKERVRADLAPLLLPRLLHHLLLLLLPPPLLLPVQKFRLPGKSWDPIIRVSSIVMQITITNRRQGRSPGRYRGKRISVGSLSLSLSFSLSWFRWFHARGRIFFYLAPRCLEDLALDRGSKKKVPVVAASSTYRLVQRLEHHLELRLNVQTIKILVTSCLLSFSLSLSPSFFRLLVFSSHLHSGCALKILLLERGTERERETVRWLCGFNWVGKEDTKMGSSWKSSWLGGCCETINKKARYKEERIKEELCCSMWRICAFAGYAEKLLVTFEVAIRNSETGLCRELRIHVVQIHQSLY